jgi:hypothetical protein
MMKSVEEYQNLVEVLKLALTFYAKGDTHYMEIDGGQQARFALSKIEEFNTSTMSLEDELKGKIAEMTNIVDNLDTMADDDILNALKYLK